MEKGLDSLPCSLELPFSGTDSSHAACLRQKESLSFSGQNGSLAAAVSFRGLLALAPSCCCRCVRRLIAFEALALKTWRGCFWFKGLVATASERLAATRTCCGCWCLSCALHTMRSEWCTPGMLSACKRFCDTHRCGSEAKETQRGPRHEKTEVACQMRRTTGAKGQVRRWVAKTSGRQIDRWIEKPAS